MTTEHTVVSFRQTKKKTVQFSGRLLANYRDLYLQLEHMSGARRSALADPAAVPRTVAMDRGLTPWPDDDFSPSSPRRAAICL
jgi:hypothetical protein